MAGNLITSLLSLAFNLLPSIITSAEAPSSSLSNSNNSQKGQSQAVKEDLERLMQTLEQIKATLYDAEEREIKDRSVKLWLTELKKVAYDAEDVLSEYRYEVTRVQVEARKAYVASSSHKGKQMESIEYIVPIPDDMVDRLTKIRSRFDEIATDRDALQLRESDGVRRPNNKILRPLTGHMVDEASIFGRDAEIEEVIDFLLSEKEKSFSVISIVGKGGLGKTTIAQLIYKDKKVSKCFDLFGWVCVSEESDIRRLIKATIESISKINNIMSELSPLQEELAKTVKGKSILLVLDDVWNENQTLWELFWVPFKKAKMVRILVTTRNDKVAKVMKTTRILRPSNLPESSCWQLFQHYAFSGTSGIVPTHLVDMGRDIMRKCGGLPLAVKSIASLLRNETYEECWREILESDLWESNPSNDIFSALQISYVHLPPCLKPCFLICSMYPKDKILKKMNLIELWISHGYIEYRGKRKITEIGVEYYEELKQRSFLDYFSDGTSEYCKLHDIIHDLARLISKNEYYSVEINNQPLNTQNINVPQEVYHLHASGFSGYINQILPRNLKGLRTLSMDLVCYSNKLEGNVAKFEALGLLEWKWSSNKIPALISTKFETLRVLELKGIFGKIPDFIPELKHLVHLRITSKNLNILPLSICLLYNLRTLILCCDYLEDLPENIGDLANLQFLYIESMKIKNLPKSLCLLSNLQTLSIKGGHLFLDVPHDLVIFQAINKIAGALRVRNIAWLNDMKDLEGTLSIEELQKMSNLVDAQHANLRNKSKLEALGLCWDHDPDYYIFPDWKTDLRLKLSNDGFDKMSNLVDAYLRYKSKVEALNLCRDSNPETREGGLVDPEWNFVDFSLLECLQPHPNLKKLRVRWYRSATLPKWIRDPFSLQSIQELSLEICHSIKSLPFGNLHSLKHLSIYACSSIQVLQLEKLPSLLEKLHVISCFGLEMITGLGHLDMLADLKISFCISLKSITMESTQPFSYSSHEYPHIGQQRISSLKRLEIEDCKLLRVLTVGLIPYGSSCYARVSGCGCTSIINQIDQ